MSPSDSKFPEEFSGFDSVDCINIIIDGPGDAIIPPTPPHVLQFLMAERERLIRLGELPGQPESQDKPADESDGLGAEQR